MKTIQWDERLSLGIEELDKQHKGLLAIANEVIQAAGSSEWNEQVRDVMQRLREYTLRHFSAEEGYMEKILYPDLMLHKQEHKRLVRRVKEYQAQLEKGVEVSPAEVRAFLKEWLVEHILGTDMAIGRFVRKKGVELDTGVEQEQEVAQDAAAEQEEDNEQADDSGQDEEVEQKESAEQAESVEQDTDAEGEKE